MGFRANHKRKGYGSDAGQVVSPRDKVLLGLYSNKPFAQKNARAEVESKTTSSGTNEKTMIRGLTLVIITKPSVGLSRTSITNRSVRLPGATVIAPNTTRFWACTQTFFSFSQTFQRELTLNSHPRGMHTQKLREFRRKTEVNSSSDGVNSARKFFSVWLRGWTGGRICA